MQGRCREFVQTACSYRVSFLPSASLYDPLYTRRKSIAFQNMCASESPGLPRTLQKPHLKVSWFKKERGCGKFLSSTEHVPRRRSCSPSDAEALIRCWPMYRALLSSSSSVFARLILWRMISSNTIRINTQSTKSKTITWEPVLIVLLKQYTAVTMSLPYEGRKSANPQNAF